MLECIDEKKTRANVIALLKRYDHLKSVSRASIPSVTTKADGIVSMGDNSNRVEARIAYVLSAREWLNAVDDTLKRLDEYEANLIKDRYIHRLDIFSACEKHHISRDTFYRHLYKALLCFAECFPDFKLLVFTD